MSRFLHWLRVKRLLWRTRNDPLQPSVREMLDRLDKLARGKR